MHQKIVIEATNLTKIYKTAFSRHRVKALDNLNLQVYPGEIFGLLGPNGSGKTTTMKIFLGLIFPTSGQVLVLGKSPKEVAIKDRIGFLPEESYLYRFLNAEETLDFYGRIFRIPRAIRKKKIDELLELVGLNDARKRPIKEYSKGMARRLGFAQAIINDPEIVFLDEPTSGLDPIAAHNFKNIILDLKRQGKAIILSSHLLADVENVCDRILILHNGILQKVGPVKELLAIKGLSQILAQGLSDNSMERVKKTIDQEGGKVLSVQAPSETLENLFLKTIKKEEK